jgi:predicted alpha/beta superfamily hydrolase
MEKMKIKESGRRRKRRMKELLREMDRKQNIWEEQSPILACYDTDSTRSDHSTVLQLLRMNSLPQ